MASQSLYKGRGKKVEEGRHSEWWCMSSQVTGGALISWRWSNICLSTGRSELIPCFALPLCSFCFPYWTFLISAHQFSSFHPFDSLPLEGEWTSGCLRLDGCQRLNHDRDILKPSYQGVYKKIIGLSFPKIRYSCSNNKVNSRVLSFFPNHKFLFFHLSFFMY